MTFDLYVWKAPRELGPDAAAARIASWRSEGGDPAASPFEASDDVAWFYRELIRDEPELEVTSDATPSTSRLPVWLQTEEHPPPARLALVHFTPDFAPDRVREVLGTVLGLAAKYDLVVYEPHGARVHEPLAEMAEYASATFWPRGAIRAFVAGAAGLAIAVGAWVLGIPIVNVVGVLIGGFLFVMAAYTLVVEGRRLLNR